jgi:hypothetical protein
VFGLLESEAAESSVGEDYGPVRDRPETKRLLRFQSNITNENAWSPNMLIKRG